MSADVVTIYEYQDDRKCFLLEATIAGKLWRENLDNEEITRGEVPYKLVNYGKSIYVEELYPEHPQSSGERILRNSNFAKRERIKSVVGVLLKQEDNKSDFGWIGNLLNPGKGDYSGKDITLISRVSAELPSTWQKEIMQIMEKESGNKKEIVIGVMFINYRRSHKFSTDEKTIIDILATSAAIAVKRLSLPDGQHQVLISDDIFKRLIEIMKSRKIDSLSEALGEATGTYSFLVNELKNNKKKLLLQEGDTSVELKLK